MIQNNPIIGERAVKFSRYSSVTMDQWPPTRRKKVLVEREIGFVSGCIRFGYMGI